MKDLIYFSCDQQLSVDYFRLDVLYPPVPFPEKEEQRRLYLACFLQLT